MKDEENIVLGTAGEDLEEGDMVYLDKDGKFYKVEKKEKNETNL